MTRDRTVRFVVPDGIDDPERVSGGNVYDRRLRDGLRASGWELGMVEVSDGAEVAAVLAAVPRGETVLIDGLVAGWSPESLQGPDVVLLAHMVVAGFPGAARDSIERERRALLGAGRVIATSEWTAAELVRRGLVPEDRIAVAAPGSDDGPGPRGTARDLLCVGVIAPHKGQDLLLDALDRLPDRDWSCTIAGSRAADPEFAGRIASASAAFDGRVRLTGVLDAAGLDRAYQGAGVLVAPSRTESFGMAIADARRRGLPVIATAVGGIPETVAGGGAILVPGDDPGALADALRRWMTDPVLRARLRDEAAQARSRAPRWSDTVARVAEVLGAIPVVA